MADDIAMNITSKIVALSSAVAFALQIALALLMLRYFSPEEVGTFSVISQIGFFWTTLALAQAPLQLLANHGVSVFDDARQAWFSSLKRFVWLLPVASIAVWLSGLSFLNGMFWTLLLSLCQFTWMLAQSMRLRMDGAWAHVRLRVLPPLITLLVTYYAEQEQWSGPSLLLAALSGYAIGTLGLAPAFLSKFQLRSEQSIYKFSNNTCPFTVTKEITFSASLATSSDTRPTWLRMLHSLMDALLATALLVIWQRQFGAQETGWLAAPLRILGFVPAVIHMAWAQVLIAQHQKTYINPGLVGLAGFFSASLIGAISHLAFYFNWIDNDWKGIYSYLWMLILWQGSACMTAAYSHRPFQTKKTARYSMTCIGITFVQLLTLTAPVFFNYNLSPQIHFNFFVLSSVISSLFMLFLLKKM